MLAIVLYFGAIKNSPTFFYY